MMANTNNTKEEWEAERQLNNIYSHLTAFLKVSEVDMIVDTSGDEGKVFLVHNKTKKLKKLM